MESDPCKARAANCSPAIQPSVRVSSAAMSSAERFQTHHLVEKSSGFGGGKTQVGGAQFGQLVRGRVSEPGVDVDPHGW